ncbi:hypothetical protein NEMBOFW57_006541 [Staphylotrichum longicolle]|uniref:Acid phosphatase-like protein n=1 Tax=Staphylotrichum longicolle TaxID=669026 RepID=A0AAD4HXI5_9PEZI|nr:hypothetical protein NEMBOFW57_006541 [Staphylotrichum longicolle]
MNTAGAVILAIVLLLLAAAAGWVIFTRVRASRLGLPPPPLKSYIPFLKSSSPSYGGPAPAPGGIVGWINDRIRLLRNRNTRTAAGAYEGSSAYNSGGYSGSSRGNHRGFDHLDPDDAWDARVGGYNPYEEERELGLAPPPSSSGHGGQYHQQQQPGGDGYQMNLAVTPGVGGPQPQYEEERRGRPRSRSPEPEGLPKGGGNPFGDEAEPSNISLRGVSPRPMDSSFAGRKAKADHDDRRSMFREEV